MIEETRWDVAVIGAGPAGLAAAREAAAAGARTVVLERAEHPRYKTCGGGLIGLSLAAAGPHIEVPSRADIDAVTFTYRGRRTFRRRAAQGPLLRLVRREEFDTALRDAAVGAGAEVRERATVRGLEQHDGYVEIRLADRSTVTAARVIGADGSSGVTARHVGVEYAQVDLGLELEIPVPPQVARRWHDRVLLDWGPLPGSYAWVFPKGDTLTVGVIASRGYGEATREYLRGFVHRLGLDGYPPVQDSGHLTRCRSMRSALRHGRVIVAGDAAGLLEPWTREGISFALRSGALAGRAAAAGDLDRYVGNVLTQLVPDMTAGTEILAAFEHRPDVFHNFIRTPAGWWMFREFCRGRLTFAGPMRRGPIKALVTALAGGAAAPGSPLSQQVDRPPRH